MGGGMRKKVQLGIKPIGGANVVKSRKMARRITSQYHILQKRKQKILAMPKGTKRDKELENVEEDLKNLGGIDRYQQASVISTQHFKTSKWVLQTLRRIGKLPSLEKLRTLEVGAINDQLYQSPLLDVRAIDINSQLPCIEECDFFSILPQFSYKVVVCSMVINCVFHPLKRGEMLLRLLCHLEHDGILILVLPSRCLITRDIRNQDNFQSILEAIGYELVEAVHNTPHLTFFVLRGRRQWLHAMHEEMRDVVHSSNPEDKAGIGFGKQKKTPSSSSPLWFKIVRNYFRSIESSADSNTLNVLASYRSNLSMEEISETEDFSLRFSSDFSLPT